MTKWVAADERLPTEKEAAAFGAVEVIVQCNRLGPDDEPWQAMRIARPIFIGRNLARVLWVTAEDKSQTPIENGAWFVSHWRPFPKFPKPVEG